jgi:putative intracellular protease/amidase
MARVLILLPERDFDPTEVAVSWSVLQNNGHDVWFASPDGLASSGDDVMLTGQGLDPWGRVPVAKRAVGVGRILRADKDAREAYDRLVASDRFRHPLSWDVVHARDFDGLLFPGGHRARGMRPYLESSELQALAVEAFAADLPVAAICHGVLVLARAIDPITNRSVLWGHRTTSLTWALEKRAWSVTRLTRWWDRGYYRTYTEEPGQPAGFMSVEQEVTRALKSPADYENVTRSTPNSETKASGVARDTLDDARPAFIVQDGSYLSARWPGDVHTFASRFSWMLDEAALTSTRPA